MFLLFRLGRRWRYYQHIWSCWRNSHPTSTLSSYNILPISKYLYLPPKNSRSRVPLWEIEGLIPVHDISKHLSCSMTKPTKWPVLPVWSESSLSALKVKILRKSSNFLPRFGALELFFIRNCCLLKDLIKIMQKYGPTASFSRFIEARNQQFWLVKSSKQKR